MYQDTIIRTRLKGLMALRLLLVTLFMSGAIAIDLNRFSDISRTKNLLILGLIVGTYALSIGYAIALGRSSNLERQTKIQLTLDICLTAALVSLTGGVHASVFLFTMYLPIIGASLLLDGRWSVYYASATSAFLMYMLMYELGLAPPWLETNKAPAHPSALLFEVGLNITFSYLLAAVSGQLAQQLSSAEEAIEQKEEDLRALRVLNEDILASLNSGLLTINGEDRIIFFNRAAENITGVQAREVIDKYLKDAFPDIHTALPQDAATRQEHRFKNAYRRPDGADIHLGFSVSPLRSANQGNTGWIVIFQDLTQIQMLEARAKRSERLAAVGELSAAIAHEIRNPLASISGSVEVLQMMVEAQGDADVLMNIIVREVDRLNGLITDFLEYSRPRELTLTKAVAVEELRDVLKLFRHRAEEIEVTLHVDEALEGYELYIDTKAFRQIMWNLLNNAADAMSEEVSSLASMSSEDLVRRVSGPLPRLDPSVIARCVRAIHVTATHQGNMFHVQVEDTGPGLPEELEERIFEPFFTTKREGTGLGLATIFRLVEEHQGWITTRSPDNLTGACFEFALPMDLSPGDPDAEG